MDWLGVFMFDPVAYNIKNAVNHTALIILSWWPFVLDPKTPEGVEEIKKWQAANGLMTDGGLGPASWAILRSLYAPKGWLRALPHGYNAVRAAYGDLGERVTQDGKVIVSEKWKKEHLVYVVIPSRNDVARKRYFVKELAAEFQTILGLAIDHSGYNPKEVQTWVPRIKRGGGIEGPRGLSAHCWCAVDFDPSLNPWGNKPSSPLIKFPLFLAFFRVAGWSCGANWKTPDTMHVQACTGI